MQHLKLWKEEPTIMAKKSKAVPCLCRLIAQSTPPLRHRVAKRALSNQKKKSE